MSDKFATRKFIILDEDIRNRAIALVKNAPLGIEVLLCEPTKTRGLDQNALMWAGPLADIADQAFLPDADDPDLQRLVKHSERWSKWDYLPGGERVLVGSTTDLTVYGFGQYLEQVYAFGAGLGVMFRAGR